MVDLPQVPRNITTSEAPQSHLSSGQIAQPFAQMGEALNKIGQGLNETAVQLAEQAGLQAVTRDAQGNLQVEKAPIIGPAAGAYQRAVKFAALAEGEGAAKRGDIELRQQYRDNPEGYLKASEEYRKKIQNDFTKAAGPEVGIAVGRTIDATTTQTYRGLLNEKERLDLKRAEMTINTGIQSARDDLVALARGGITSGPQWDAARDKINTLTDEKVNNPRLAYPKEAAEYDRQHLDGELRANGFLHHIDEVYKDQGVNEDGSAKGGAKNALQAAESILTDSSIKLTEQQREHYYAKAKGEIHANEAIRRQDVSEARAASQQLFLRSAMGDPIAPEEVEQAAAAHRAAGDPAGAARVYGAFARKPLNDDFGKQPLDEQTRQLEDLRSRAPGKRSYAPEVEGAIKEAAAETGVSENRLRIFTAIESGGSPGAQTGSYRGLLQLSNTEFQKHGGGDIFSARDNMLAGARKLAAEAQGFKAKYGREPTDTELYLQHQQGVGGAAAHMANPDAPAWHNMYSTGEGQQKGPGWAKQAIWGNIPTADKRNFPGGVDTVTSADFMAIWQRQIARRGGDTDVAGTPAPYKVAQAGGPLVAPPSSPAQQLWLQANRARTLDTEAVKSWQYLMKEYDAKGIRPADAVIQRVTDAARATNNHGLLEQIAHDTDRIGAAQDISRRALPEQQAAITDLQRAGQEGTLDPGQAAVLKDIERRHIAIMHGLSENPISTAVTNFGERFQTPAPLNFKDPTALAAGLAERGRIAQFAAQNWQTKPLSALDKNDIETAKGIIEGPDLAAKSQFFASLTALPEPVRNATLSKLVEKGGPDLAVSTFAGSLQGQAPDIALSILRGQQAMKTDPRNDPTKELAQKGAFAAELDKKLPQDAFSLEGRTNPHGAYATMRGAIVARYADIMAQQPGVKKDFSSSALAQATSDVTGGVLSHNGASLIAPSRGMPQEHFDNLLWGIKDADLAGVTSQAGQPITAAYLRGSAQLEGIGQGRYLVRLGRDPLRPIYAFQDANTESPRPYVLNLRGRQAGTPPDQRGSFGIGQ